MLLVLIVIFLVIAPLVPRGLRALVPPRADAPPPREVVSRDIVISVAKDGVIEINRQRVDAAALPERLAGLYRRRINRRRSARLRVWQAEACPTSAAPAGSGSA